VADFRKDFVAFCLEQGVLKFGRFVTKSGRTTPYFFNAGLFNTGASLERLAQFYAKAILASGVQFDMLFGPAYKGIVLAASTAVALAREGRDVPYAFNRKEAKDHGAGGRIAGALDPGDKVVVTEDTVTRGTSLLEAAHAVQDAGAVVVLLVAVVDRGGTVGAMAAAEGLEFRAILTAPDLGFPYEGA